MCISCRSPKISLIGNGWAKNSVNTVIFRKNAITSTQDSQYLSYYNEDAEVILAKREQQSDKWEIQNTGLRGNAADAHNSISIAIDGNKDLHMAWDHHNTPLKYIKQDLNFPVSEANLVDMIGSEESVVSYPEFYNMSNGDLLFFYRDGESGNGNLVINRYNHHTQTWKRLHNNLIDGEGQRNAYWQACVDQKDQIHISWVWRESGDVASNHDISYARSSDGGKTWTKSDGSIYNLPITAENAEYVCRINQGSELINQTSMTTDHQGYIYIVNYWTPEGSEIPQFHVVFGNNARWQSQNTDWRQSAFSLSGYGTKKIPISRPEIISWKNQGLTSIGIIFRDEERGNKISLATNYDIWHSATWKIIDINDNNWGEWEPNYDLNLWDKNKSLNLFAQKVQQLDSEGVSDYHSSSVQVIEWSPKN